MEGRRSELMIHIAAQEKKLAEHTKDGPTIEQYEMEPAKSAQNGRQDLASFLTLGVPFVT